MIERSLGYGWGTRSAGSFAGRAEYVRATGGGFSRNRKPFEQSEILQKKRQANAVKSIKENMEIMKKLSGVAPKAMPKAKTTQAKTKQSTVPKKPKTSKGGMGGMSR